MIDLVDRAKLHLLDFRQAVVESNDEFSVPVAMAFTDLMATYADLTVEVERLRQLACPLDHHLCPRPLTTKEKDA